MHHVRAEPFMLRVPILLGLIATVGCRQPVPPPVAVEQPPQPAVSTIEIKQVAAVRGGPLHWCAEPRPNDPLLLDAIELATFDENDGSGLDDVRVMHGIARLTADQIIVVSGEETCERAARAYDKARSIYRSSGRPASMEAVHVVSLGPLFLVESAGDRRQGYEVKLFDLKWRHLRGGYGVEF